MKLTQMNKDFEALIGEVVGDNVTCYYDLDSLNEAIKSLELEGMIQPAAHCGIYARNDKSSDPDPAKQIVLVKQSFKVVGWHISMSSVSRSGSPRLKPFFIYSASSLILSWVSLPLNLSVRPTWKGRLPLTCSGLLVVPLMVPAHFSNYM